MRNHLSKKIILTCVIILITSAWVKSQVKKYPLLPKYQTEQEKKLARLHPKDEPKILLGADRLPESFSIPAEFEELQAVVISWPRDEIDGSPDVSSFYARLFAKVANGIQQEIPVWIRLDEKSDTTAILNYMIKNKTPLKNYRFFYSPGNTFWMRDFGPLGFYYSDQDSLAFLDLNYYPERDLDDEFPIHLGKELGYNVYSSKLNTEGGNFMIDGLGKAFYSDRIIFDNTAPDGIENQWTDVDVTDTLSRIYNADLLELRSLECDGGTGHIDMYIKLIDEETIIATEYPAAVTAQDREIVAENLKRIKDNLTSHGREYIIHYIPFATNNSGNYNLTCSKQNDDARGFINGITLNKTFLFPSFSSTQSGNVALDSTVTQLYRKLMPGYKVIPIDSRQLTILAGAIHCITMQIPAENPIRFIHANIRSNQDATAKKYPIKAQITNRSGIKEAKCFWRKRGESIYKSITLADSSGYFVGAIPNEGFSQNDTIQYYLFAESNNGKNMTKPIVAPEGYIEFTFAKKASISESIRQAKFTVYPNPTGKMVFIHVTEFALENQGYLKYTFINSLGQEIVSDILHLDPIHKVLENSKSDFMIDVTNIPIGIYQLKISLEKNNESEIITTMKVGIAR